MTTHEQPKPRDENEPEASDKQTEKPGRETSDEARRKGREYMDRSMSGARGRARTKMGDSKPGEGEESPNPIQAADGSNPKGSKAKPRGKAKGGTAVKERPPARTGPLVNPEAEQGTLMMVRVGRILLWPDGQKRGDGGYKVVKDDAGKRTTTDTPNCCVWSNDPFLKQLGKPHPETGQRTALFSFEHVVIPAPAGCEPTEPNQPQSRARMREVGFDWRTGTRKHKAPKAGGPGADKRRGQRGPMSTRIQQPDIN